MSSSISATDSNYSLNSLVWATKPLTPDQQAYLNANYSVGPNNGTVKVVDGITSWNGNLNLAALGIESSRVDSLPLITYGPSGKPIVQKPLTEHALPVSFGAATQAIPEIVNNGVLVPISSTTPTLAPVNSAQAASVSTDKAAKTPTLADVAKAISASASRNEDFNLLESFFNPATPTTIGVD